MTRLLQFSIFMLVVTGLSSAVGCSTTSVYENQKSETQISKSISDAGGQVQTMKSELERHQKVLANLGQRTQRPSRDLLNTAKSKVTTAEKAHKELEKKFNSFRVAAGEFAAYAHTRPKVYSVDADWRQADDWQKTLVSHSQEFNQSLKTIAEKLNDLSLFWQTHNLFRKQSVAAMADDLQSDTENWRTTYAKLVTDFNAGQANFNRWQERRPSSWSPTVENALHPLQAMHKNLDEMSQLIQQLDKLKDEYYSDFSGSSEVSSLDPAWVTWQKYETARDILKAKFVAVSSRCTKYFARFNQALQDSALPGATNSADANQKQSPQ